MKKLISWFQGWFRYFLYYSKEIIKIDLSWLIRKHIKEQIEIRINSMNRECYNSGSCIECGCATTALQMANKACEGYCYPSIISKHKWNLMYKNYIPTAIDIHTEYLWCIRDEKFMKSLIRGI